ncbi:MAG: ABC transporter ATP-binding protein [Opitutaceae bacterium]|nr:ABC transporter ATP-binding protein [Opitutaceae bacterium]
MSLELRQLEKCYRTRGRDTQALAPSTFSVQPGEFISLLGPSGCGKSTLLYLVAGLDEPTAGSIELAGVPVCGPGRDRGMVFQNYTLFPWLRVRENVQFALTLAANTDYWRDLGEVVHEWERADSLLELMGLADFAEAYPRELSGGMKQRVAIARALVNRPKLLLMDEPFGALDAQTREELQEMLLLLHAHEKMTVLFVTHDIDEALFLSTRVLVFSARPGRIIRDLAVPFGPARPLELKVQPEFLQLRRELFGLLHQDSRSGTDRAELLRKLVRREPADTPLTHSQP